MEAFNALTAEEKELFLEVITEAALQSYNLARQCYLESRQNVQFSQEKRQQMETSWQHIEIAHQALTATLRLLRRNAFVPHAVFA